MQLTDFNIYLSQNTFRITKSIMAIIMGFHHIEKIYTNDEYLTGYN
jgi:hypothetical protein